MLASLVFIALVKIWLERDFPQINSLKLAFWLETIALIAFGVSWLTKGQAIFKDAKI